MSRKLAKGGATTGSSKLWKLRRSGGGDHDGLVPRTYGPGGDEGNGRDQDEQASAGRHGALLFMFLYRGVGAHRLHRGRGRAGRRPELMSRPCSKIAQPRDLTIIAPGESGDGRNL